MAVPKSKITRSKRGMRRAHDSLKAINVVECPNCGEQKIPHHICKACGYSVSYTHLTLPTTPYV